jgi:multiple sugar transport system substrate-binding protein
MNGQRTTGRFPAAVLTLALLPVAIGACSSGGSSPEGGGGGGDADALRVVDWYNDGPNSVSWKALLDECGTQIGVTVDRETIPGESYTQKVLQQVSSKTLPDVLMLDNPVIPQIAASGALTPLSDYDVDPAGIADGVLSAGTYDGELYALQPITNTIALFYNRTVFEEAGLTPPTTWEELRTTAAALTVGDRYGFAMSAVNGSDGTWQFLPFMWSNGGDEKDIDTPETAAALQLVKDLLDAGSLSQSSVNWQQADVADQFSAGKAAMMVNGPWNFPTLDAVEGLEYGIVPIPAPTAGATVVTPFGGEAWTVPQTGNPDKQAKAAELVQCLNEDDHQVQIAVATGTVPTKPDLADEAVAQNPNLAAFAEQVPNLRARTAELGEGWADAQTKIYTALQNALVGGLTPEQALAQAQDG